MASRAAGDELNLTKDELQRLSEALKKEEFRKLLVEYAEEISDPENRKRYEAEIAQMENERGMDVKFINPEPGYVIKTSVDGYVKAFINVCKNEHIAKPSFVRKSDDTGKSGMQWSIPHSFAPPKDDIDKKGEKCKIYDVVFNPDTYRMSQTNIRFKQMLTDTAIDGIERQFGVTIDRKNVKYPKIKFKGVPQATVIRTRKSGEDINTQQEEGDVLDKFPYPYDNLTTEEKSREREDKIQQGEEEKLKQKHGAGEVKPDNQTSDEFTTPKYTITHQSNFDLQHTRNAPDAKPSTRPDTLVIKIFLPLIKSASAVNLDIFEKRLSLESKTPAAYKLDMNLPYPVDEENGSAKFDKSKSCLMVTLPVVPADISDNSFINDKNEVTDASNEDKHDEHCSEAYDLNLDMKIQASSMETSTNSSDHANVEELSCSPVSAYEKDHIDVNSHQKDIWLNVEYEALNGKCEADARVDSALYSFPEYNFHQDCTTITFILHVSNVPKETVSKSFPSDSECSVKFASIGSSHFPMHYSFCVQFEDGCSLSAPDCIVDASKQNVVITLAKQLGSQTLWGQFKAGVDRQHLKEKSFASEKSLGEKFDELEAECENMPNQHDQSEDPMLMVTEMHEEALTVELKYEDALSTEEECCSPHDSDLSSSIEVVHHRQLPKLKGIMKQRSRTLSESSDEASVFYSRENSTNSYNSNESPISESEEYGENGLKKSVSFSDHVDKTLFKGNTSVTALRATLKNKRRRAKKKEIKSATQESRRRRRSSGSEPCSSADEHSSQQSHEEDTAGEDTYLGDLNGTGGDFIITQNNLSVEDLTESMENDVIDVCLPNKKPGQLSTADILTNNKKKNRRKRKKNTQHRNLSAQQGDSEENGSLEYSRVQDEETLAKNKEGQLQATDSNLLSHDTKHLFEERDISATSDKSSTHNSIKDVTLHDKITSVNGTQNRDDSDDDEPAAENENGSILSWKEEEFSNAAGDAVSVHATQCAFSFQNNRIFDLDEE